MSNMLKPPPKPDLIKGLNYTCKEKGSAPLLEVSLSLSRKCNLRCEYCFTNGGEPRPNELTTNDRKKILTRAAQLGAKTWYLAGDGEPFLDIHLFDLIRHANSHGLFVVMFTNGMLIDGSVLNELMKSDVSLIVKWNSSDEAIFKKTTNCDRIKMVEYNGMRIPISLYLCLLRGFAEETPTRLGIETVVTRDNQSEISDMLRFCNEFNVYPHIERLLKEGRALQNPHIFPHEDALIPPHLVANICRRRFNYSIYIRSDGEAFVCFSSNPLLYLGSIRQFPLDELISRRDRKASELQDIYGFPDCMCSALEKQSK